MLNTPDHADFVAHIKYHPETGVFERIKLFEGRGYGPSCLGEIKGSLMYNGYINMSYRSQRYLKHRLAWFYMTGTFPKNDIDHKNRDRSDNRWENLREATRSQNCQNVKIRSDNKSGHAGVKFSQNRWSAEISVNKTKICLGRFLDKEAAIAARLKAESIYFPFKVA